MSRYQHGREQAFILRCWFEDETTGWRFILEPIGQDWQRAGFADAAELLSFLQWNLDQTGVARSATTHSPREHAGGSRPATGDQRLWTDDNPIKE